MKHSLSLLVLFLLVAPAHAQSSPETIAVVAGANVGAPEDDPLRYAEADAKRLRSALVELGGVRSDRALLVLGGGPAELRQALDEARGRAAELAAAGHPIRFLFYYSGHGDEQALHLPRGSVAMADLHQAIARIPGALHLSFIDACRSIGREKGVRRGAAFSSFSPPDSPSGTVEIRASSMGEAAQESEELGGAIFTHYLVSGLRGAADSDGDGQVTLPEVYAFAYRQTLRRTGGAPGLQHPTLNADVSGAGEVVLSRTARAAAALEVPAGADRYLVFAQHGGGVMAEVGGEGGRSIALPAGRFLVVRRQGARAAVADVDMSWGGRRTLSPGEFRPISREELAARGGQLELHRSRLDGRLGVEIAPGAAEGPAAVAMLGYGYARGLFELDAALGYIGGPISIANTFHGASHAIAGRFTVGVRLVPGRVSISPSFGVAARYAFASLERDDRDRALGAGLPIEEHANGGAIGPSAGLRLGIPLPRNVVLSLGAVFDALLRREIDGLSATKIAFHPTVSFNLGIGRAF